MPFEKGKSGNAGGKSKSKIVSDALRVELLADDKKKLGLIARALIEKAVAGDVPAIKEIMDRTEGKSVQPIAGDDDSDPIRHVFTWDISSKK